MKILVLNGINLNMFGKRDPAQYGTITLAEIDAQVTALGKELGVEAECFQTNIEGEMAERIERLWAPRVPCTNVGRSLERALQVARSQARSGDIVLFSPGTSSFDMFRNYAERGNQFRQLVQSLTPKQSQP